MDAQIKLCFERLLDLQLRQNGIVEVLCQSAMVDPETRRKLIDITLRLTDALKRTKELISK